MEDWKEAGDGTELKTMKTALFVWNIHVTEAVNVLGLMTPVTSLFAHEHTRPDRDNFISVNTDNIKAGKEGNFGKKMRGFVVIVQTYSACFSCIFGGWLFQTSLR